MEYKIVKNSKELKATNLTKEEAIKQLAIVVDDFAMATNYYLTDENYTVKDPDNGKVIFEKGNESALIGDNLFEILPINER